MTFQVDMQAKKNEFIEKNKSKLQSNKSKLVRSTAINQMFLDLVEAGRSGIITQWKALNPVDQLNSVNIAVFEAAAGSELATGNVNLETALLQYNSAGLLTEMGTLYRDNNIGSYNVVEAARMADTFNQDDMTENTVRSLFLLRAAEGVQNSIRGNNQIKTGEWKSLTDSMSAELREKSYRVYGEGLYLVKEKKSDYAISKLITNFSYKVIDGQIMYETTMGVNDLLYNSGLSEETTSYLEAAAFSALTEEVVGGGDGYQGQYSGLSQEVKMEDAYGNFTTYAQGDKSVEIRMFDTYQITDKVKMLGITTGKKYRMGIVDPNDSLLVEEIVRRRKDRVIKKANASGSGDLVNVKSQQGGRVITEGDYELFDIDAFNDSVAAQQQLGSFGDDLDFSGFRSMDGMLTRETGLTSLSIKGVLQALGQLVGRLFGKGDEGRAIGGALGNIFAPFDVILEIGQGITNAIGITENSGHLDFSDWSKGNPLKQIGYAFTNAAVDFISGMEVWAGILGNVAAMGILALSGPAGMPLAFAVKEGSRSIGTMWGNVNEKFTKSISDNALKAWDRDASMYVRQSNLEIKRQWDFFSGDPDSRYKTGGEWDWGDIVSDALFVVSGLTGGPDTSTSSGQALAEAYEAASTLGKISMGFTTQVNSMVGAVTGAWDKLSNLGSNLANLDLGSAKTLLNVVGQLDTTGAVKALHDIYDYAAGTKRIVGDTVGTISLGEVIKSTAVSGINIATLHAEKGSFSKAYKNSFKGANLLTKGYNLFNALDKGAIIVEDYEDPETGEIFQSTESGYNALPTIYINQNPVQATSIDYKIEKLPGSDGFVNNYKAPSLASATSKSNKRLGAVNQARYNWSKDYKALDLGKVLGVA
jgi:hypothetical protein